VWPAVGKNASLPEGPDRMFMLMGQMLRKRIKMQGFIIFEDYGDQYSDFSEQMQKWLKDDKIKYKEHVVEGLENTVSAFNDMLSGKNFGKTVVKISGPI
jgi:hypothetical protein